MSLITTVSGQYRIYVTEDALFGSTVCVDRFSSRPAGFVGVVRVEQTHIEPLRRLLGHLLLESDNPDLMASTPSRFRIGCVEGDIASDPVGNRRHTITIWREKNGIDEIVEDFAIPSIGELSSFHRLLSEFSLRH